jgi:hypothetical protein
MKNFSRSSEVEASRWMGVNCRHMGSFADRYARLRLTAYGNVAFDSISNDIFNIRSNSCFLAGYNNTAFSLYYTKYNNDILPFLLVTPNYYSNNNNRVYTNSQAEVFSRLTIY